MTNLPRIVSLLLLLALISCASAPPVSQHYLLPSPARGNGNSAVTEGERPRVLVLQELRLASYLDDVGIVLQLDDITLHPAQNHRWAEPLAQQLHRGLRQRLERQLPEATVLDGRGPADSLRLRIDVERFHGRYDGQAVAGGRWQLWAADGSLLRQEPFAATVMLANDGYPALVRALGAAWDQVATAVASACREALSAEGS